MLRPTTLWSDTRRLECYETSLRIMAQLPAVQGLEDQVWTREFLQTLGLSAEVLRDVSVALDALHTNFVDGSTLAGAMSNRISLALRRINPKSHQGRDLEFTNLNRLGKALLVLQTYYTVQDFALGAALQEALAGDLALARLAMIRDALLRRHHAGQPVDSLVFEAIVRTEQNLTRSEDYFGALMVELSDRRRELARKGVKAGLVVVKKDAVPMLARFYQQQGMSARAAETKASMVAAMWTFSLYAVFETIASSLDQHHLAQTAVTSATLADMLAMEIRAGRVPDLPDYRILQHQGEHAYYDFMVRTASGLLPRFHDLFPGRVNYREVREYFSGLRDQTAQELASLDATIRWAMIGRSVWVEPFTGMEFVWVPEGCFLMGCGPWAGECRDYEKPVHEVCVSGFWMGKYEVTQGQWEMIMDENWAQFQYGDDYPMENVGWNSAQEFISRLNGISPASGFRLPTEAEWEYACRGGGRKETYCGGNDLDAVAWHDGNSGGTTRPVGTRQPNALGIYDMSGNVTEWVLDCADSTAYSRPGRSRDPVVTDGCPRLWSDGPIMRVERGGAAFYFHPNTARAAVRGFEVAGDGYSPYGFRLVRRP